MMIFKYETKQELKSAIDKHRFILKIYDGIFEHLEKYNSIDLEQLKKQVLITTSDGFIYSNENKDNKYLLLVEMIESNIELAYTQAMKNYENHKFLKAMNELQADLLKNYSNIKNDSMMIERYNEIYFKFSEFINLLGYDHEMIKVYAPKLKNLLDNLIEQYTIYTV